MAPTPGKSDVWTYFERNNKENAKCKMCSSIIGCKGSSTSGMARHLRKHSIEIKKIQTLAPVTPKQESVSSILSSPSQSAPKKAKNATETPSILKYVQRQSLCEIIAQLIAFDGISIRAVTKSAFIRESLSGRGYNLPGDCHSVMELVHEFHDIARNQTAVEIGKLKSEGMKFGATLEEWWSFKRRRYLNVNVHSANGVCFNLGVIRVTKHWPAETMQTMMLERLKAFGLSFTDIVAATTDGAGVMMTKFGEMISCTSIHQGCYNHAIHLAVADVLFQQTAPAANLNSNLHSETDGGDVSESDEDDGSDDDVTDQIETCNYQIRADINNVIKMVRKIVKFFKNSPMNNSVLQKHVQTEHGKELALILDHRMRWTSSEQMIERFVLLHHSIVLALIELNASESIINVEHVLMLKNLIKCLQPIKLAAEELSRPSANLLTAEAVINFLLETLGEQIDCIGQAMCEKMQLRIYQQRNNDLLSLMQYLQNKDFDNER